MQFDRFDLEEDLKLDKFRVTIFATIEDEGELEWICIDLFESNLRNVKKFFNKNRLHWRDQGYKVTIELVP